MRHDSGADAIRDEQDLAGPLPLPIVRPRIVHDSSLRSTPEEPPTGPLVVDLGMSTDGILVQADIDRSGHVLVSGETRAGKTMLVSWVLEQLCRFPPQRVRFALSDPKAGVDLKVFGQAPHCLYPVAMDYVNTVAMLKEIVDVEMRRRFAVLAEHSVRNVGELREAGHCMPTLLVCLEEVSELCSVGREVEPLIMRIAQCGQAAGIVAIIVAQLPEARWLSPSLRANLPTRVCFRLSSERHRRLVMDRPSALVPERPGEFLLTCRECDGVVKVKAPFPPLAQVSASVERARQEHGEPVYMTARARPVVLRRTASRTARAAHPRGLTLGTVLASVARGGGTLVCVVWRGLKLCFMGANLLATIVELCLVKLTVQLSRRTDKTRKRGMKRRRSR